MGNAIKNNLLKKTVQSPASAKNVVVVYDKSSDTAAPISTTKHGETSGAPPTTTSDTLAESKAVDPTEIAVETTAGSVNSETEMANEEASMPGSNPEVEQEAEPESEPEIEPDVESE